jgi:hypothetical protein
MADNTILKGAPGIAEFNSETWGNVKELRLQDSPATATKKITITAGGTDLTLGLWSVVDAAGLAPYSATVAGKTALGILTAPVFIIAGQSVTLDVLVAGYFDYEVLTFAATFDTPAKMIAAFEGMGSPINIILDTNPYDSDGVLA